MLAFVITVNQVSAYAVTIFCGAMLLLHVEILVSAPNANREDVFVAPFRGKWHSPAAKKQERLAVAFI
jgi:hypothetical protein